MLHYRLCSFQGLIATLLSLTNRKVRGHNDRDYIQGLFHEVPRRRPEECTVHSWSINSQQRRLELLEEAQDLPCWPSSQPLARSMRGSRFWDAHDLQMAIEWSATCVPCTIRWQGTPQHKVSLDELIFLLVMHACVTTSDFEIQQNPNCQEFCVGH
jgi:hypothetical protein